MASVEILITGNESTIGTATLKAAMNGAITAGLNVRVSKRYEGRCQWLCVYGVGAQDRNKARVAHVAKGGRVACFDLGYFSGGKDPALSYVRVSVDHNHPHRLLSQTPNVPERFVVHGITLREDADPDGRVVVIGLGPKSRVHLNVYNWEITHLRQAQQRFPNRQIVYRPKPYGNRDLDTHVDWQPRNWASPIEELLKGASLVMTRHSNVAIDACIAGVPFEAEDGAAFWLSQHARAPTREQRLDFLYRLAHWQYKLDQMTDAWKFLTEVIKRK